MAVKSYYTEKQKTRVITQICDKVIEEKISFNQAVKLSGISLVTFYKWIATNETLRNLYNYAREVRSDVLFEEIIEIADTTEIGTITKETLKGTETITSDMTEHRKLKIDARKWAVAKMQPKKYGDKISAELTGADGAPLIPQTIKWGDKIIQI